MNNQLYELIWKARKIAFFITDTRLIIRELHGAAEMIDANYQSFQGRSLIELFPELVGAEQDLQAILDGKLESIKFDYVNRELRGVTHYLSIEDFAYRDDKGKITGILHMLQDISTKGELEQQVTQTRNQLQLLKQKIENQNLELSAANSEMRRLGELKSQFISIAAQELRMPLTTLNGAINLLADRETGPLTAYQRTVLETIQKSGQRLTNLVDELLDAAGLEMGRIDLVLQPTDLANLVREVSSEFAGQIQAKSQHLEIAFPSGLPMVLCDQNWTKLIVNNLLSNAVKFTPDHGRIEIRMALAEQPGFLQLSVSDTGISIPEMDQAKIFSRWFRSRNAEAAQPQGPGLGLYITHSLVELHNGSIRIESTPDHGSVFHITFPIAD